MKVHSAALQDQSVVLLLDGADEQFPRVAHVWLDEGYTGSKEWIERELGWTVQVVQFPLPPRGEWIPLGTRRDPRPFEWRGLPPERTGCRSVLPRQWSGEPAFS